MMDWLKHTITIGVVLAVAACQGHVADAAETAAGANASPSFSQILPRQTVFSWVKDSCSGRLAPDGPPRAYRRADGKLVLMSDDGDNWAMVGTNPFNLATSCAAPTTANYNIATRGSLIIEGTYTEDGTNLFAIASEDMSRIEAAYGCVDHGTGNCWLNALSTETSGLMGQHWTPLSAGNGDLAAITVMPENDQKYRNGFFTTSNIIKRAGYYYTFAYAQDGYSGAGGNCLIRSNDLSRPSSWKGWSGTDFTVSLEPRPSNRGIPCALVGGWQFADPVRSVSFIPGKGVYIAVTQSRFQLTGDAAPVPGAYYSTSSDLLNWSPVKRLMMLPSVAKYDSWTEADSYPVLIDPFSKSRNFETIDSDTPVLAFVVNHLVNGGGSANRDVVAIPLQMR